MRYDGTRGEASTVCPPAYLVLFVMLALAAFLPAEAVALSGADVAIYNDAGAPYGWSGAWQDGVTAIKNMISWMGYTWEEITYEDINSSTQDFSNLYRIIFFPGGYAYYYNYWISLAGKERIRDFVADGGSYFGICAGSFFASDRTVWEGSSYDDSFQLNAWGEWTGYDLDLFQGSGTGPLNDIADWNGEGYNMATFNFDVENEVLSGYKAVPYVEDILYYGGPYFTADAGTDMTVLATYDYNNQPAIIAFEYGYGRVVLFGPHPEIEEDSDRDGVTINREDQMSDNGSDWEMVSYAFDWLMTEPFVHTLYAPSEATVARGGFVGPFYASVANNTSSSYPFYIYPWIGAPDGVWRQLNVYSDTLAPNETKWANGASACYLYVPTTAPTGWHYHWITVYNSSSSLVDSDYFVFEVTTASADEIRRNRMVERWLIGQPGARVTGKDGWKLITVPFRP